MLPTKLSSVIYRACLLIILSMFVVPAYAILPAVNAETMLINLNEQMPQLMKLATAISYILGMYFIIAGIIKFKHVGESRTMMSQEHSIAGPLIMLAVGAFLLYFPTTVEVGMSTFWSSPNPYGYEKYTNQWNEFLNVCFSIIQLVGVIAFIRGLVILSHLSGSHGQQGTFGRGLTHVIGGIFCINIYQTVQTILATFGLPSL